MDVNKCINLAAYIEKQAYGLRKYILHELTSYFINYTHAIFYIKAHGFQISILPANYSAKL